MAKMRAPNERLKSSQFVVKVVIKSCFYLFFHCNPIRPFIYINILKKITFSIPCWEIKWFCADNKMCCRESPSRHDCQEVNFILWPELSQLSVKRRKQKWLLFWLNSGIKIHLTWTIVPFSKIAAITFLGPFFPIAGLTQDLVRSGLNQEL